MHVTHNASSREPLRFMKIESFSEGKHPPKNEDLIGFNETTLVLSDGATDKSGQDFEGKTGGELAAQVVVETCLGSDAFGESLVRKVSDRLGELYAKINPAALTDSAYRFAATMIAAKLTGDELIITQVGDSSFRVNGSDEYTNNKAVDALSAEARRNYIEATGDVAGSREFIMPLLKGQYAYQNNPDSPLGYGIIDGTPIPPKFIKTYTFNWDDVQTLEIVSDGYYGVFPETPSLVAYETLHETIERTDPDKYGKFASTKVSDDRTVIIAHLAA